MDLPESGVELRDAHVTTFKPATGERSGWAGLRGIKMRVDLELVDDGSAEPWALVTFPPLSSLEGGLKLLEDLGKKDFEHRAQDHRDLSGLLVVAGDGLKAGRAEVGVVRNINLLVDSEDRCKR